MTPARTFAVAASVLGLLAPALAQRKAPIHDAATRLENHARHLEMRDASRFADLEWRFIGPEIMSGRITGLAVPTDPRSRWTIYAATASGGVWKTVNEGTTWVPITDDLPSASVGAIAVAPGASVAADEPDEPDAPHTVWIGLGESNILRSSMAGTGVYRSTDAGDTWEHLGLAATHTIARIVLHPDDPDRVWVAASGHEWTANPERGVYKTTDGGVTWEQVLFVDDRTGAIDLAIDPSDPDTLYAAMWERMRRKWNDPEPGPGTGIWKTTDGGDTWGELRDGLPARGEVGRIGLAVARSRPETVYALLDNAAPAREATGEERDSYGRQRGPVRKGAQLYRSDDRGETWYKASDDSREMERLFSTYGWVFGQVRVDPSDADTVYALGVELLRSTDGGKTFAAVRYQGLHADHHDLWIDPEAPGHLVSGNDGGINLSYDGGKTWRNIDTMGCVQFYNVAYDMAEPFRVYGSIQDNHSWRGPVTHRPGRDPVTAWETVPGGEASYLAVDPSDQNVLYSSGFYGRIQRSTLSPRKTDDIVPKAAAGEPALRGQWLAPFALSPHNPRVIYHGMQCVFRSVDRGDHWQRISDDLTRNDPDKRGNIPFQTITALSESPLRFGLLYAGTDDGRRHVTPEGGASWTEITEGMVPGKWLSRVAASAFAEDTVYAAQSGKRDDDFQAYLWRSRDRGATWQDIAGGIPGGPINVVKEDPRDGHVLYVGTDLGVYATIDGARTWHVLGKGLPIAFVHDLIVHPRDHVLVIATHGRGMWRVDVKDLPGRRRRDV